jgi:branched-chain amino acid transport system ATP-binding protein
MVDPGTSPGASSAGRSQVLEVSDLQVRFGGVVAIDDVSFAVERGEVCGLIGPNGAGKTTVFNCISRLVTPSRGDVLLDGESLLRHRPHAIAELGIARTFQQLGLLPDESVLDNVLLGAREQRSASSIAALRPRPALESRLRDEAAALLELLQLDGVSRAVPGELPIGTLKRVELARALMALPTLILLDEPANGLSHGEVDELGDLLLDLRRRFDLTLLLVEHHMGLVTRVADRAVVLDFGRVIASGPPREVCGDPVVVEAYLGTVA